MRVPRWLHPIANALARPFFAGRGCAYAMHRVLPEAFRSRLPSNRALEITPESMDGILRILRAQGTDIVPADEIPRRLASARTRRFAAFLFDDGYSDNLEHALPVFEKHCAPLTVFPTTGFLDRTAPLWWYALEDALARNPRFAFRWEGKDLAWEFPDAAAREAAFGKISGIIRGGGPDQTEAALAAVFSAAGIDPYTAAQGRILDWDGMRVLAAHPLVSIGCHGERHLAASRLDADGFRREFVAARARLENTLGKPCRTMTFPFGDPLSAGPQEADRASATGYAAAFTTIPGNLFAKHGATPCLMPRHTLSGNYDAVRVLARCESGLAGAIRRLRSRRRTP